MALLVEMNLGRLFVAVFVLELIVITKSVYIDEDGTQYQGYGSNELFGDGEFEEQEYEDYVSLDKRLTDSYHYAKEIMFQFFREQTIF